ncbi:MAG: class I SAM-dependent methyltransferase [Saprospiraceae bacterium]
MDTSLQFYWELYSEYYSNEQIVHKSFNPLRDYEEEFIDGPILDIGCGQSNFLIEYSITNRDIYAVDNEKYQLEKLHQRILDYTKNDIRNITLLNITLPNEELPDVRFALIILSNILHFFEIVDCKKIIEQLEKRTLPGSLIFISVHSTKYYMNNPENPDNNEYFKHYFSQEDLDSLFKAAIFERIYSADIQRQESKLGKLIVDKWIDKNLDYDRIFNKKTRGKIKADYLSNKSESDIVCIYRKK